MSDHSEKGLSAQFTTVFDETCDQGRDWYFFLELSFYGLWEFGLELESRVSIPY